MLNLITFLTIVCFLVSLFSWRYLKDSSLNYAHFYIGIGLTLIFILARLRLRPIIILSPSLIAILLLIALLLCFLIILCFYYFRESSIFISSLKFFKHHYQDSLRQLQSTLFNCFPIYYKICYFLLNIFPGEISTRVIALFIFNILPFSFLNMVIFKQMCLGYFNLQFLLLLTLVQLFSIWLYIAKYYFEERNHQELLPLYRKMVTDPDTPISKFIYQVDEELFLLALSNASKVEEIYPLFNGMTPEEYIEHCYYISENLIDLGCFQNLVNLINRYGYLFTFSLSLLILFLSLGESLTPSFVSYSFSFLNHFYYLYF